MNLESMVGQDQKAAFDAGKQAKQDGPGLTVDPFRQFASQWNTVSKVYSPRWDEARRASYADAMAMRRDAFFLALMQERCAPLTGWKWEVKLDPDDKPDTKSMTFGPGGGQNPKDPYSNDRDEVEKALNSCVKRTAGFHQLRQYMGQAIWFGRYGSQFRWDDAIVGGHRRKIVGYHDPIVGDKVHYTFDGHPGVMISPSTPRQPGWDVRTFDNYGPVLVLNQPELRNRFAIHRHIVEDADYMDGMAAGRRHGIGVRDQVYWAWWMRDEMLAWLMGFMEKVGSLGILCFFYNESNDESRKQAKAASERVGNGNSLAIPVGAKDPRCGSVELIPANMTGVGFLKDIAADYFERHIERLIVGQSMSGGADADNGLGGSGRAQFAQQTKFYLLQFDANNLGETFTSDFVQPMAGFNFPGVPWRYEFRFILPDPGAKDKLEAGTKLVSAGVPVKMDELREAATFTKPGPEDETVGGQQPGEMMPGGDPAAMMGGGEQTETPGMAELVTAMVRAGANGNVAAVNALARLGSNPEQLETIIGGQGDAGSEGNQDHQDTPTASAETGVTKYRWAADRSDGGNIKAIWTGVGQRKPLYGAQAEAALRGQDGGQSAPGKPKPAGGARLMEQFRERAQPHRQRAAEVYDRAIQNPGSVKPEELGTLADHLNTMTAAELRETAKSMSQRSGGLKEDVVRRLLEHVGAGVGDAAVSARNAGLNFDARTGEAMDAASRVDENTPAQNPMTQPQNATKAPQFTTNTEKPSSGVPRVEETAVEPEIKDFRNSLNTEKTTEKEGVELPEVAGRKLAATLLAAKRQMVMTGSTPVPNASTIDRLKAILRGEIKLPPMPTRTQREREFKGQTEASKELQKKRTSQVDHHVEKLKNKIDTLDKKESVAKYIQKTYGKILWDSQMETIYGSMAEAVENGFPRWLLTKQEADSKTGRASSSIDQVAQQTKGILPEGDGSRHDVDKLVEMIVTGARTDVQSTGEREKLANELYLLESARNGGESDGRIAEAVRRGRAAHLRQARQLRSEKASASGSVDEGKETTVRREDEIPIPAPGQPESSGDKFDDRIDDGPPDSIMSSGGGGGGYNDPPENGSDIYDDDFREELDRYYAELAEARSESPSETPSPATPETVSTPETPSVPEMSRQDNGKVRGDEQKTEYIGGAKATPELKAIADKHGKKYADALVSQGVRLVPSGGIHEYRPNGYVVKSLDGKNYTLHLVADTDGPKKNWRIGHTVDVTDQYSPSVPEVAPKAAATGGGNSLKPDLAAKGQGSGEKKKEPWHEMGMSGVEFESFQKLLGVKNPKMGENGTASIQKALSSRPGGNAISTIMGLGKNYGWNRDDGTPRAPGDAVTKAIDGKHSAEELLDAAHWAASSKVRDGANRFLYDSIASAKTDKGERVDKQAFSHMAQAADLENLSKQQSGEVLKETIRQANKAREKAKSLSIKKSDSPDWYQEYRELRNRMDMGGKLTSAESARLAALEKELMAMSGVKPNQYRAPWGGLSAYAWWDSLTITERRNLVGSSNFRVAASGLHGNAASQSAGVSSDVDRFAVYCYQKLTKAS